MPGPTPEQVATSRLAVYQSGRRSHVEAHMPGQPDQKFRFVVVTASEKQIAKANALRRFEKLKINPEIEAYLDFHDEEMTQILWFAMRNADHQGTERQPYPITLASSADELRDLLDVTTRDILYRQFCDFEHDIDPERTDLTQDECDAIDAAVKKKGLTGLSTFEPQTLRLYIATMASQQST